MKFLLWFISGLLVTSLSVPKEDSDFETLIFNKQTPFKLNDKTNEVYFKYSVADTSGKTLIRFFRNDGYNVVLYVYEKLSEIAVDDEGNYINFSQAFRLSEDKEFVVGSGSSIYYLIIKSLGNFGHEDYIYIINEKEEISLTNEESFSITRFLSTKTFKFSFVGQTGTQTELSVNKKSEEMNLTVSLYRKGGTEVVKQVTTFPATITIDDTEDKEKFLAVVEQTDSASENEVVNVMFTTIDNKKINILSEETEDVHTFISTKEYIFKKALTKSLAEINAENIVRIYHDDTVKKNNFKTEYHCRIVNADYNNDDELLKILPTEENNICKEKLFGDYDTFTFLFYKNKVAKETDKDLVLLVRIKVISTEETKFAYPMKIATIIAKYDSASGSAVDKVSSISPLYLNYFPLIIKLDVPQEVDDKNILFYFSFEGVTTYYNGDFLNEEGELSEIINTKNLFLFSNKDKQSSYKIRRITILFFGISVFPSPLIVQILDAPVLNPTKTRPSLKFFFHDSLCKDGNYIIGKYDDYTTSYLFSKSILGEAKVFYKGKVEDLSTSVLPDENNRIKEGFTKIDTNLDLIYYGCNEVADYKFEILSKDAPEAVSFDVENTFFIKKKINYSIKLPELSSSEKYYLTIKTELDSKVTLTFDTTEETFDKSNPFTKEITGLSGEIVTDYFATDDTVISLVITKGKNGYKELSVPSEKISTKENLLIQLPKEKKNGYTLQLEKIKKKFVYGIYEATKGKEYLPSLSNIENSVEPTENNYTVVIDSPFTLSNYDANKTYYFLLYFVEEVTDEFDVTLSENKEKETAIAVYNSFMTFKDVGLLLLPLSKKSYFMSIVKCSDNFKDITGTQRGKEIFTQPINEQYSTFELKSSNLGIKMYPGYQKETSEYDGAIFYIRNDIQSLDEKDIEAIDNINKLNKNLTVFYNNRTVYWTLTENVKNYTVIMKKSSSGSFSKEEEENFHNPCYLKQLVNSSNGESITIETFDDKTNNYKIKEKEKLLITVIGNMNTTIPVTLYYNSKVVEQEAKSFWWLWVAIPLILVLIILSIILLRKRNKEESQLKEQIVTASDLPEL